MNRNSRKIVVEMAGNKNLAYRKIPSRMHMGVAFEPIVIEKRFEEGLADLVKAAQEEEQEACWLYVHDDSRWYNLAAAEDGFRTELYGIPVFKGKRKTHVHTHPKSLIEEVMELSLKYMPKRYLKLYADKLELFREWESILLSLPSDEDISTYIPNVRGEGGEGLDFAVISPKYISQVALSHPINPKTERIFHRLFYNKMPLDFIKELGPTISIKTPAVEFAKECCRHLNNAIQEFNMDIKEHGY
ncbi:MAG: hypothetical protein V1734_03460 [Nanoarchaeota archaeon]